LDGKHDDPGEGTWEPAGYTSTNNVPTLNNKGKKTSNSKKQTLQNQRNRTATSAAGKTEKKPKVS